MKLHIPSALRAALLSCFVTVGSFSYTLATSTMVLGVVSYSLVQPQAQAAVQVYTGGGVAPLPNNVSADDDLVFNITAGWLQKDNGDDIVAKTYVRHVLINTISNAVVYTFNNAVADIEDLAGYDGTGVTPDTPNGGFYFAVDTTGANVTPFTLTFAGAMSEFSGNIVSTGSGMQLVLTDNTAGNATAVERNASAAGTGIIKVGGRQVRFNMTGNVTVNNESITVSSVIDGVAVNQGTGAALNPTLQFENTGNYTVSSNILADNLSVASGTTVTFNGTLLATPLDASGTVLTSTVLQTFAGTTTINTSATLSGTTNITGSLTVGTAGTVTLLGTTALGDTTNNGQLTLGGTVTFTQALAGTGTVTLDDALVINIDGLTDTGSGNESIYRLFAEGMTVEGALVGTLLTSANLSGVSLGGREWMINADGTLTSVLSGNDLIHTGGDLAWGVGEPIDGTDYEDGDLVTFNTADATVTLSSDVAPGHVTIDGVAVSLTGAGNTLDGDVELKGAGSLILKDAALGADSSVIGADGSSIVYDLGAGNSLNNENQLVGYTGDIVVQSGTLLFQTGAVSRDQTYSITVKEGAGLSVLHSFNSAAITVEGAADASVVTTLTMQDATYGALLTTSGYVTLDGDAVTNLNGGITTSGVLIKKGANTVTIGGGTVDLNGELQINEGTFGIGDANNDNFDLTGVTDVSVATGATLRWQHGGEQMTGTTLTLNGGTLLSYDMNTAFAVADAENLAVSARWGKLAVGDAGGTVEFQFKGKQVFNEMTGTGDLTINFANSQYVDELRAAYIEQLVDYNGTITHNAVAGLTKRVYINNVNQATGKEAHVVGDHIYATDFTMQGEGSFTVGAVGAELNLYAGSVNLQHTGTGSLTVTGILQTDSFANHSTGSTTIGTLAINDGGSLQMTYEGTLNITGGLTLGATAVLGYDSSSQLLNINAAQAASTDFTLNLLEVDRALLAAGYDLGLDATIAQDTLSVLGLTSGYTFDDSGPTLKITINADAIFDLGGWDINWGPVVIAAAPTTLPAEDAFGVANNALFNQTSSGGEAFTTGTITSVLLSGGGSTTTGNGAGSTVYGGSISAAATTNSWIQVTGGEFIIIAGGSLSGSFTGDSHILLNQTAGSVNYIVGGNSQDSGSPTFTGSSYISIYSDTLAGSVIGGSTNMHSATTTFNGNTNIYIYTPLNLTATHDIHAHAGGNLGEDVIVGSNAWGANVNGVGVHNGHSNVTVDLRNVTLTEATTFGKRIIGGSFSARSWTMNHTGNTNVTITGTANLTFTEEILGGTYSSSSGSLTHTGSTYLTIHGNGATFDSSSNVGIMGANYTSGAATNMLTGSANVEINGAGSTFNDRVVAGSDHVAGTGTIAGGTNLTINGGTFTNYVMAGSNQHNGTFTLGGTSLTITDGSFTGKVFGGSVHAGGTNTNTGGSVINISGGTFTNNLHGGSIDINNAVINSTAGLVEMNLTGGTFSTYITGGSFIGEAYTGSTTADGGVSITIDGATMEGNIIGGHIRTEGTTAATVGMGDVAINLVSGTVGADVHAAGHLTTAFTGATTASTTVSVGSAVTFDGTGQIINGDFGGAAAASGVVTGDRKLVFGDNVAYNNVGALSYRNFDTVEVTQADGDVSISDVTGVTELMKTGAGTLTLGAQTDKNIHLSEGTLKFSATSSLTDLNIGGGVLDLTATQLTLNGEGIVSDAMSGLTMEYGHATGIGLGASGTFGAELGAKLSLSLTGLTLGAGVDFEQVLLSGVTSEAMLVGMTYRILDNGALGFDAGDLLASLNGDIDLTDYFIYHDTATNTMILTNVMSRDLYWNAGSTDWNTSDTDWLKDDAGAGVAFKNNDNVFFSKETATISLTGDVTVNDMTAEGTDTLYSFNGAHSLTVGRNLILKNGSDVTLDAATTMILTESDVSVGADSILTLNQTTALTMKSLSGAGTVSSSADVSITDLVTAGGTLTATGKTVTLADGENVFTSLSASIVVADHIKIGGGTIGLFDGTQVAITGGDVTITLLGQNLESFSNAGSFTTTGGLTITNAVSTGGTVTAADVSLAGTSNIFTQLTATDVVQDADATLSLGGTSRITSLNEGALEIDSGGTVQITTTAASSLTRVTGGGGLTTGGDLSLTGTEASTVGALTVAGELTTKAVLNATSLKANNLVLGADLILTGSLDASSLDEINVNHSLATTPVITTPSESAPLIKASGINLGGATEINFIMTDENLLSAGLSNGDTYVLAELTTDTGIVDNMLKINDAANWMIDTSKFTIVKDGHNIVLKMTREGNTWEVAGGSGLWSDGAAWSGGFSPTNPGGTATEAILAGTLPSTGIEITLGADALASSVVVETDAEGMQYTLTGGNLSTPSLQVNKGVLSLESATVVLTTGATIDSQLVLGANGKLMLDADSSLTAKRLDFNAGATLENAGSLSIDSFDAATAIITNTGTLTLGDGSALATVIGDTGSLATQDGAQVSIGALQNSGLDLGAGSTLSVDAAMTLSTMTGTGLLTIGTGSDDQGLTVATDSTGIASGGLQADSLTLLSGSDATFTQLAVNSITIEGDLSTTETRLSAGSLSDYAGTGGKIDLDISADTIDALMTGSGGVAQSYYVYEQAGITWDDFAISEATKQAVNTHIIAEGNDILLTKQGDTLTFTMQESTDRLWKTSDNFALTAGSAGADISVLMPIYDDTTDKMVNYDILNTVDRVYVNEDFTIDLVGVDAVSILPDTPTLHIQNLAGDAGKTLTIIGDGATEDNVSLRNTQTSYALNDLVAKNVTVSSQAFGLGVVLELASVSLEDAVLDVLPYRIRAAADAETGTTVGSLSNKEGDSSLVRGTLSINGAGGVYTGSYDGAEINALAGADQVLQAGDGLTIKGDAGHLYITEAAGGQMDGIETTGADVTLDMRNAAATQSLTLANGSIMDGGTLTILLNDKNVEAGETQQVVNETGGSLTLNPDTNLMLKVVDDDGLLTLAPGSGAGVELVEISEGLNLTGNQIDLGSTLSKYFADLTYDPTTGIISAQINTEYYATFAQSANGLAGLEMMTDVMISLNPLGNSGKYPELAEVMTALDDLLAKDPVAADRLAASIAGAGNLGLGMAVSGDMARQLGSIRNRTMSMGTDPSAGASGEWGFNGWINAETSSTDLSGSGTTAGYKLSSWGGTVGAEANVNERFTFGLALSSMYGDYSSNDVDTHTGEVNTNYLSAFARLHDGRWSHSFVISGGLSELSTSRTVSYAGGSYDTSGDTEGSSFGMLYELAYTYAMNEESSTAWQPLVSVAFQTSSVDAYTESGSDAALSVGEQNVAYATLGLGARMETVVGENIYNRSSVLSLRAMAKADFGDDSSEASVSMARGTESSTVTSAERGMYGLEVGAGLVVPIMSGTSSLFFDANFEVRENQNSFSATAGYRFSF